MSEKTYSLNLPKKGGGNELIECKGSLLFIGANGAGKTRLGTWIELNSPQSEKVHRISAQKSLSMPDTSTPTSIEMAESSLIWGNPERQRNKAAYKWGNKPATALLSDFDKLMVYLFSDETEQNAIYKNKARESDARVDPPVTKMDRVKDIWEKILPHRELVVGGLRIQTRVKGSSSAPYKASEMSDGERVIFYLIGQCLAAPADGIIVIDEPELHLHKSVQAPLWAEVERLRQDCLFVYLTHDVDFAAAQENARKIWLKSYDGAAWDWEVIQYNEDLPDALLLEVLGSRKPVVFVEGENGSFDVSLYREILSEYLVIPRGGCASVIQATKALRANSQLHHLEVFGIVDRDRRVPAEIAALEASGVYVLEVAEVENLFCCEEIIHLVSERLSRDPASDFSAVKRRIVSRLQSELDAQVSLRVSSEVKHLLSEFEETAKGEAAICSALTNTLSKIDVTALYATFKAEYGAAVAGQDYPNILKIYNRKSLATQVSSELGLANGELPEMVIRMARGDQQGEVKRRLKRYFGTFGAKIA